MHKSKVESMGVIAASWERYERANFLEELTDRERRIAHEAFLGGARTTYGLVATFSQLSRSQQVVTDLLESLGDELCIVDEPPRPS